MSYRVSAACMALLAIGDVLVITLVLAFVWAWRKVGPKWGRRAADRP